MQYFISQYMNIYLVSLKNSQLKLNEILAGSQFHIQNLGQDLSNYETILLMYYLFLYLVSYFLFFINTLQLNYFNIFSMERSMNCSGSHPKPMAFTTGTPTKQNPCKAQIEFLPAITSQKSM